MCQYVLELRSRLQLVCRLAYEVLSKSVGQYRVEYDTTWPRYLEIGDEVLVLICKSPNKLVQ